MGPSLLSLSWAGFHGTWKFMKPHSSEQEIHRSRWVTSPSPTFSAVHQAVEECSALSISCLRCPSWLLVLGIMIRLPFIHTSPHFLFRLCLSWGYSRQCKQTWFSYPELPTWWFIIYLFFVPFLNQIRQSTHPQQCLGA